MRSGNDLNYTRNWYVKIPWLYFSSYWPSTSTLNLAAAHNFYSSYFFPKPDESSPGGRGVAAMSKSPQIGLKFCGGSFESKIIYILLLNEDLTTWSEKVPPYCLMFILNDRWMCPVSENDIGYFGNFFPPISDYGMAWSSSISPSIQSLKMQQQKYGQNENQRNSVKIYENKCHLVVNIFITSRATL